MNTCRICRAQFTPKRRTQELCSVTCRQKNNGKGRRGQCTGPQSKDYTPRLSRDGHLRMYAAKHPFADGRKEMNVHDMVMELYLGRRLVPDEVAHHRDGIKTNNDLTNLELMSRGQHSSLHMRTLASAKPRLRGRFA